MDWPKLCTTRLLDQNFGMSISPQDILVPFFTNNSTNYYRPWKLCEEIANKEFGSTIDNTKDKFKITLDVQHFQPHEVSVKVNDKEVIIEGKHEEKKDEHGFISRQFVRRYILPKDCLSESVSSTLSSDGVLSVIANKKSIKEIKQNETIVPIKMAGPCKQTEKAQETPKTCEVKSDKSQIKNGKFEIKEDAELKKDIICEMKKDTETKTDKCELKIDENNKKETQLMLQEEHSRLLKPELLGEAVSGTEKLIYESRKETDELLKLMSNVRTMPKPTEEKLDAAIGQCKAAMKELKKEKGEMNTATLSEMASMASAEVSSMTSSEISSSSMTSSETSTSSKSSAEMSSMKSTMLSEAMEMTMSSSTKAKTEKTSDIVSEIICAELKEAATENI